MRNVGQKLSQLRKERELGQKELAALLNMSIGTISNYENNVHAPDLATLCRLADFFQVTAARLRILTATSLPITQSTASPM